MTGRSLLSLLVGFVLGLAALDARADFGPAQGGSSGGGGGETLAQTLALGDDAGTAAIKFGTNTASIASDALVVDWAGATTLTGSALYAASTKLVTWAKDGSGGAYAVFPADANWIWKNSSDQVNAAIYHATASPGTLFVDADMFQFSEGSAGLSSPTTRLRIDGGVIDLGPNTLQFGSAIATGTATVAAVSTADWLQVTDATLSVPGGVRSSLVRVGNAAFGGITIKANGTSGIRFADGDGNDYGTTESYHGKFQNLQVTPSGSTYAGGSLIDWDGTTGLRIASADVFVRTADKQMQVPLGGAFSFATSTSPSTFDAAGTTIRVNNGTPESVVTAPIGSLCCDYTNGHLYIKRSGTGNTGWQRLDDLD